MTNVLIEQNFGNEAGANNAHSLAILGGSRALKRDIPVGIRWDNAEREQLYSMVNQRSLFYWNGPQSQLLTQRFNEHYPLNYVMPCSSGTAAIHIAIAAAGVAPGDEVITSPITDMGTVIGILYQQGVPVFADLEPNRYNLDPVDVEKKITPRTKAILAVHLAGNPCDLSRLRHLANKYKITLIEDCAQAWGAEFAGQAVGTFGDIACFSLNDFKHIGCGDGGIVASNSDAIGPLLQKYGDKAYDRAAGTKMPEFLAPNYRISEPQSAIAAVQMTRVKAISEARAKLGRLLTTKLSGVSGILPHQVNKEDLCSFWFYMFRLDLEALKCDRKKFVEALQAEGLPCTEGYIVAPVYKYPVFQDHNFFAGQWPIKALGLTCMDYRTVCCPTAELILETCVTTPISQWMDEAWIDGAAEAIRKVASFYAAQ